MKSIFGKLNHYSIDSLRRDFLSGTIVGVIAIPLGMAFAIASGVNPEYGIYTTIIAGILISIIGGSKFQIAGPTGAFIPVLLGVVMTYGYTNLLIAGFMAGIMLFLMGIFKLGSLIKYIPRPVTIGFTSGIAVIIFTGQVASFLGLTGIEKHEEFIANAKEIIININTVNLYSVLIAIICLVTILVTPKWFPKIPGPLIGLLVSTLIAAFIFPDKVATIGSAYGEIPSKLPSFIFPDVTLDTIIKLIQPAFVIAILGGIESLLSAVVADGMSGTKHDSNRELIGQGIANMVTPLFGGIPATGAIARTATNIKNGAVTRMSGVIHGFVVLIVLLVFAPYASHIPLASMAPILMVVAWNMSERKSFAHVLQTKSSDSFILVTTFLLTVFANLTVAVEVGLVLAAILFVKRMSGLMTVAKVLPDQALGSKKVKSYVVNEGHDCPQISIFTIEGPLFFGAAQMFEQNIMTTINHRPKVLILRMGKVPYMDTTGEATLTSIVSHFRQNGGKIIVSGLQPQPMEVLIKTGLDLKIERENFFERTGEAIDYALTTLNYDKCIGCRHFAFEECSHLSKPNTTEITGKVKLQV